MTSTKLTDKQQAFINEYLLCWNATKAARKAGYSEKTAYSIGWENLRKPEISEAIQERMKELTMSANEALFRLSEQARADMGDFLDADNERIDLAKADENGKLHLIKKFSHTVGEKTEHFTIELYDAQSALVQIIKERHLESGEPTNHNKVTINLPPLPDDQLDAIFGDDDEDA